MVKWTGQFRMPAAKKSMHTEPFASRQCRGFATGKRRNRSAARSAESTTSISRLDLPEPGIPVKTWSDIPANVLSYARDAMAGGLF